MEIQSGNPFDSITSVENAQELLDIAFDKAMKSKPPGGRGDQLFRSRQHELNRINTAANVIADRIERIVQSFPSIDKIHPYYQEICDLYFGVDQLKISLGRVYGVIETIRSIQNELSKELANTYHKQENKQIRKKAFGRFSSLIYQISDHLDILKDAREKLLNLPGFDPSIPTVVITGVPNAGKSSFINKYTSGKPEIASYPFTTKEVIFGHRKLDFLSIQFVDTPGLLDRSFHDRNDIELQALLALQYLSDIMVFFVDPVNSTNNIDQQLHLFNEISEFYPSLSLKAIITKSDLVDQDRINEIKEKILNSCEISKEDILNISIITEEGIDEFISHLETVIKEKILSSRKFRYLTQPKIAEDQLPIEFDDMFDRY